LSGKHGYRKRARNLLDEAEVEIGDIIRISKGEETYEGALIPRTELSDDDHLVVKLKDGYNIGILVTEELTIKKTGKGSKPKFLRPPPPPKKSSLPKVVILSTGGTIASRVDYRTGGVRPALTANDLYSVVPELSNIAMIKTEILLSIMSENITPKHWEKMAQQISAHIHEGTNGIVVAHGTDTIGYTAAALSFALQNLPVPVVLVGSQRSADRPSSDAATNLAGAVRTAANGPFAEVVVAMHETVSDGSIIFHRGTKVRKCHTSRRDAFESVNALPLARLKDNTVTVLADEYRKRDGQRRLTSKPLFDENVALIKFHPSMNPQIIKWHVDKGIKGIVLEGTGLGHVGSQCFADVKKAIADDVIVSMASQCIWGRINMNVYDTGRELLKIGVIPLADMLPETALVKMMWALGNTENTFEAKQLLTRNITYEFTPRSVFSQAGGRKNES
jgi:glutamyl-tRNA(Gln) amidotransferase subunit D